MLHVAREERSAQRLHLRTGIVDDPLDEDIVAAVAEGAHQRVADRERAPLHDNQRSGRIGAAEFERDASRRSEARARSLRRRAGSRAIEACHTAGARRTLMKPATASIDEKRAETAGDSPRSFSMSAFATSFGERRATLASVKAMLVAKSPNSGRRGASNVTGAGSASGYVRATMLSTAFANASSASSGSIGSASSATRLSGGRVHCAKSSPHGRAVPARWRGSTHARTSAVTATTARRRVRAARHLRRRFRLRQRSGAITPSCATLSISRASSELEKPVPVRSSIQTRSSGRTCLRMRSASSRIRSVGIAAVCDAHFDLFVVEVRHQALTEVGACRCHVSACEVCRRRLAGAACKPRCAATLDHAFEF